MFADLSRNTIRDALYVLQRGRCAVCRASGKPRTGKGRDGKLVADHDHATGLLRGLLCQPCNIIEGKTVSLLAITSDPRFDAYRANPPAACFAYPWDFPHVERITAEAAMDALALIELPALPAAS